MGPNIKSVDQKNMASGFSSDFIQLLNGIVSQAGGSQTTGPMQRESGSAPRQMNDSFSQLFKRLGGVHTEDQVADHTQEAVKAATDRNNFNADRSAARLIAAVGGTGNRNSSALTRGLALQEGQQNLNLEEILANIMTAQGDREQQAREFDVQGNLAALNPAFNFANRGILDPETVVTPGIGTTLLNAGISGLSAYLGGGGSFGLGGNKTPKPKVGGGSVGEPTVLDPRMFDFSKPPKGRTY